MRFWSAILIMTFAVSVTELGAVSPLSTKAKTQKVDSGDTAPRVFFEKITSDVGPVAQGDLIRQVFSFTNKGPGVLQILDVGQT